MASVILKDVKKIYDNHVVAVHDFNLEIKDKEFVVFVGPSGCGKSTTLRMVAGLEEISEGTVSIDGEIVNDLEPKDRNIAMVFQNYALYPHLSVFENMAFSLRLKRYLVKEPIMENGVQKQGIDEEAIKANEREIANLKMRRESVKLEEPKTIARLQKEKANDIAAVAKAEARAAQLNAKYVAKKAQIEAQGKPLPQPFPAQDSAEKAQKRVSDLKYEIEGIDRRLNNIGANNEKLLEDFDAHIKRLEEENEKLKVTPVPLFKTKKVKMPDEEIYERVLSAAKTLGITQYLMRKPRALSGGQRQRVAIGRAMVRDSKVFLMDEPLSNLDAKLRNQMRAELILLRKKIDSTFIYVTHDQTEAMTLGDRIVIMKDGYTQQVGTPQEVFDLPTNLFVATFIGAPQMNLFDAHLNRKGKEYSVSLYGKTFPVHGWKADELNKRDVQEQDITLGVRPEHMVLQKEKATNALDLEILVNEMMGSEYFVHAQAPDEKQVVIRVPTVSLGEGDQVAKAVAPGTEIHVGFEGKVMHLFDKEGYNLVNPPAVKVKETSIEGVGQVEIKPDKLGRKDKKTKKALEGRI